MRLAAIQHLFFNVQRPLMPATLLSTRFFSSKSASTGASTGSSTSNFVLNESTASAFRQVQVLGPQKKKYGALSVSDALVLAARESMDLVLIDEAASPPLFRLVANPTQIAKFIAHAAAAQKLLAAPRNRDIATQYSRVFVVGRGAMDIQDAIAATPRGSDLVLVMHPRNKPLAAEHSTHSDRHPDETSDNQNAMPKKEADVEAEEIHHLPACKILVRKELEDTVERGKRAEKSSSAIKTTGSSGDSKSNRSEVKDFDFKMQISNHDLDVKLSKISTLLKKGHSIQLKMFDAAEKTSTRVDAIISHVNTYLLNQGLKFELTRIKQPPLPSTHPHSAEEEKDRKRSKFILRKIN
ncbi:hypothetical protein HDU84_008175 [Entophlyctis sp. JEL0112]|nr:hypothetical protein HDU84_008175 [Entophlyctis sp. JEL0112]